MGLQVYFVADTHFGHSKIMIEGEQDTRPFDTIEEHDETIIDNWNKTVRPSDIIWHLGDVAMWGAPALAPIERLNGRKRLVLGNHDRLGFETYLNAGFERVYGGVEAYGFWLSHIPIHPMSVQPRYQMNVHGHLHHQIVKLERIDSSDFREPHTIEMVPDPLFFCTSLEQIDYTPISLEQIREETSNGKD